MANASVTDAERAAVAAIDAAYAKLGQELDGPGLDAALASYRAAYSALDAAIPPGGPGLIVGQWNDAQMRRGRA